MVALYIGSANSPPYPRRQPFHPAAGPGRVAMLASTRGARSIRLNPRLEQTALHPRKSLATTGEGEQRDTE